MLSSCMERYARYVCRDLAWRESSRKTRSTFIPSGSLLFEPVTRISCEFHRFRNQRNDKASTSCDDGSFLYKKTSWHRGLR
jgi:hypothetical protein